MRIKSSGEEDFNGTPCVYLETDVFDSEIFKIYIHKEYGLVMKFERYSQSGEMLFTFTRTHFETGTVFAHFFNEQSIIVKRRKDMTVPYGKQIIKETK